MSFLTNKTLYFTVTSQVSWKVSVTYLHSPNSIVGFVCSPTLPLPKKRKNAYIFCLEIYRRIVVWSQVSYRVGIQRLKVGEAQWMSQEVLARIWYLKAESSSRASELRFRELQNFSCSCPSCQISISDTSQFQHWCCAFSEWCQSAHHGNIYPQL